MKNRIFSIDEIFVKEAYIQACSSWKTKIKEKFPEIFDISLDSIKTLSSWNIFYDSSIGTPISIFPDAVQIRITNFENKCVFHAMDLAKQIKNAYPEYRKILLGENQILITK